MDSLDFSEISRWLATTGLQILLIVLFAVAAYFLLSIVTRILISRIRDHNRAAGEISERRAETVRRLIMSSGLVLIFSIAMLMVLDKLGIDIRPILASLGIVSLALGLGAQTLVKDVIGGTFIIIEGQFHIGDVIEFGGIIGTVEDMTLRATRVRDSDGSLHIIPNGELRIITNRTRGWSRATVDVTIPYSQEIEPVYQALEVVKQRAAVDELISPLLQEELVITGIEGMDSWGLRVRITGKTQANEQWDVQRRLRQLVMEELAKNKISVAQPWPELSVSERS